MYQNVVNRKELYDVFPGEHWSELPDSVYDLVSEDFLHGRAADNILKISVYIIKGKNYSIDNAYEIYRLDPLSAISATYSKFQAVTFTVRGGTFCRFASLFDVAINKYHAVCKDSKYPLHFWLTYFFLTPMWTVFKVFPL